MPCCEQYGVAVDTASSCTCSGLVSSCSFLFFQTREKKNQTATKHHSAYSGVKLARLYHGLAEDAPFATAQMVGENLNSPPPDGYTEGSLLTVTKFKQLRDEAACSVKTPLRSTPGLQFTFMRYLICSVPQSSQPTPFLVLWKSKNGKPVQISICLA